MNPKLKEILFIDGYNVVNSWPNLKKYIKDNNIDEAREKLIEILSEYQAYKKIEIVLVFDAYKVKDSIRKKEKFSNLEVVYTKERETADTYIERKLDLIGRKHRVTVATSDNTLQQIVLSRGGIRLSSRELYYDVKNTKSEIRRKNQKLKDDDFIKIIDINSETLKKLNKLRKKRD
ncbi:MAG: NYN domain-containing protein [Bacillota bacterium]|nr:NYN domain-containing protein [Bacillota bacterium]